MNKLKNVLYKWFKIKPKLYGYENCEIKKRWIGENSISIFVSKGYNNPEIDFIKDWLDTPIKSNLFPYSRLNYVADPAALLDVYMRFSYDLFCYLRDNKYDMRSLNTYEKYVNQFNIKVPGFIKPVENE